MNITMTLLGLSSMKAAFDKLTDRTGGKDAERALTAGGLLIQDRWAELAPFKTGTYRRSIHIEATSPSPKQPEVTVGTWIKDPPYPVFLEHGTSRMRARPSARPAFDERKDAAAKEVGEALKILIKAAI